ncbi:MAG TPA: SHOCT domain-containing protein [Gemmataceae bacterium]|jgi:hypothetical protein|nr:SHOCT domain-containing protein [Gemmataceae bacterium]
MNIADEIRKLEELHRSGALTNEEFAKAKAAVLAGAQSPAGPANHEVVSRPGGQVVSDQLAEIRLQNEVARLDREWELERERYMVTSRYGARYVPSRGMSILTGAVVVGFGIIWTALASSMAGFGGAAGLFPLFGVVFIVAGVGVSIYSYTKATQYEQAYEGYKRRRAQILSGEARQPHAPPRGEGEDQPRNAQDAGERVECLRCGMPIPAGAAECPHCAWSYRES